jgi:hypothetical protein
VIDMSALRIWFAVLIGWLDRQERDALGAPARSTGSIRRRPRLGGLLDYHERAA